MDFECAALQATQQAYPNSEIFECLFHFVHNMKKHLQATAGAHQRHSNDATFALHCRTVTPLAFVLPNHINEALQTLENQLLQEIEFLIDWVENYYVSK